MPRHPSKMPSSPTSSQAYAGWPHMIRLLGRLVSRRQKYNHYFWNATKCYIETGQQVFLTAALASAAMAASIQRDSMAVLLRRIVVEIGADTELSTDGKHNVRDRLAVLLEMIESSNWNLFKQIAVSRHLRRQNATLEKCIGPMQPCSRKNTRI